MALGMAVALSCEKCARTSVGANLRVAGAKDVDVATHGRARYSHVRLFCARGAVNAVPESCSA